MTMHGHGHDPKSAPEPAPGTVVEAGEEPEAEPTKGTTGDTAWDAAVDPDPIVLAPAHDLPWPDLPLVVASARLLETQRKAMRDHLAIAIDGRDPEGVHQMRVASRRLRALLRLLEPLFDGGAHRRVERSLRRVARALGRVRELDVLRAALSEMLAAADSSDPARALALEAIDARAARRQRRARASMIRRFGAVDLDRLDRQLARLTAALEARRTEFPPLASHFEAIDVSSQPTWPEPTVSDEPIPDVPAFPAAAAGETLRVAVAAAAPALAAVARAVLGHPLPAEIGTTAGLTALHEIRIGVKRLRYGIEVAVNALDTAGRRRGTAGKSLLRELKALQESLGELHDDAVLADELALGAERAERRGQPRAAAALKNLLAARRRALRRDERRARSELQRLTRIDFPTTLELRLTQPAVPATEDTAAEPATAMTLAAIGGDEPNAPPEAAVACEPSSTLPPISGETP